MGAKTLCIRLEKIDGLNGIRYLVLFASKRYDATYKRIT